MNTKLVHIGSRKWVAAESIRLLKSEVNYTQIWFLDGTMLFVAKTLGKIQSLLPDTSFIRVNKSVIVNTTVITKYTIGSEVDQIYLEDKSTITVSRRRKSSIREFLKLIDNKN